MYILKLFCALAVALLCANGAKRRGVMDVVVGSAIGGYGHYAKTYPAKPGTYIRKLATPYPIRDLEIVIFKVGCAKKCTIQDIRVDKLKGKLILEAKSDSDNNICYSTGQPCNVKKTIKEKEFTITLTPDPSFSSGYLIVELGQKGAKITELNAEGAMRLSKNLIRIKSGYKKPDYDPQRYKIQCNGPCNKLHFGADNDIKVAASKEPVFETDDGCLNCFCVWKKNQKNPNCDGTGNLGSSTFYVNLIQYNKKLGYKDAIANVRGNFKSVELYDNFDMTGAHDYENGYKAVAAPVTGPIANNHELNFEAYCKTNTICTEIKIEILTYPKSLVKTVRAGKDTSLNSKGQCKNCYCTSRQSCLKRVNPSLAESYGIKHIKINIKLGKSNRKYPGYVRVSGKGFNFIQNQADDYYY